MGQLEIISSKFCEFCAHSGRLYVRWVRSNVNILNNGKPTAVLKLGKASVEASSSIAPHERYMTDHLYLMYPSVSVNLRLKLVALLSIPTWILQPKSEMKRRQECICSLSWELENLSPLLVKNA